MGVFDDVADFAGDVVGTGIDVLDDAYDSVEDFVDDVTDEIIGSIEDSVDAIMGTVDEFGDLATDIAAAAWEAMEDLREAAEEFVDRVVEGTLDLVVDTLQWVVDKVEAAWTWVSETITGAWNWFSGLLPGWLDRILDWVVEGLADLVGTGLEWMWKAAWVALHAVQGILGWILGGICFLLGIDEPDYPLIRHIARGVGGAATKRVSATQNYVVFSDHHLFVAGSPLNRFQNLRNDELYRAVLSYYAKEGWVLIENGDVEDLWMRETGPDDLALDVASTIGWPVGLALGDEITEAQQRHLLARILSDNILTYGTIQNGFREESALGTDYVRTIGNHDDPMTGGWFLDTLRALYPGLDIYSYVVVEDPNGEPLAVIAHGHQWDAWNARACARIAGELITAAVASLPDLAAGYHKWGDNERALGLDGELPKGFANKLSELTWWPKVQFEVINGSVDEEEVRDIWSDAFEGSRVPYLILGHTHGPRRNATRGSKAPFVEYLNTGTAGRYEGVAWCVEIVGGIPRLRAWAWNARFDPTGLLRFELDSQDGKLKPLGQPELIPLNAA